MTRILFVCHGNICRSVMAEMIMKKRVADLRQSDEWLIDSAATSREEIGNDIYPSAKHCLSSYGIPFSHHAARQITRSDYDRFDLIICMEQYNIRNLHYVFGNELMTEDASRALPKIRLLLDRDVADPWYTDDFETTYRDLEEGISKLL